MSFGDPREVSGRFSIIYFLFLDSCLMVSHTAVINTVHIQAIIIQSLRSRWRLMELSFRVCGVLFANIVGYAVYWAVTDEDWGGGKSSFALHNWD